jgi:hypothetical protein
MDDVETWTIDGTVFGTTDADGCYWVVDTPTGWESGATPRSARTAKPAASGSYRAPNWRAEKVYVLAGYVDIPATPEGLPDTAAALRVGDQLRALCGNEQLLYPLRHTDARSGEDRVAFVELDDEPLVRVRYDRSPLQVDFSLQFAAPDPQRYSAVLNTASTRLARDAPGGINWANLQWNGPAGTTGVVWQSGAGENGVFVLTNDGTGYAPIVFSIHGPVTGPIIERTDTGETIEWTGTVPDESVLEINTGTGSVTLNGGNQKPNLARADFFTIPPQSSINVAFRAPAPSPDAELVAAWPHAWK